MRQFLLQKIQGAVDAARAAGTLSSHGPVEGLTVETPKQKAHGDWATNAAMVLARPERKPPRDIAAILIEHIDDPDGRIDRMEIAGPGFINFALSGRHWRSVVWDILEKGEKYGRVDVGGGRKVQVEFVSANPTGPLHIGHGRGAALGDALAGLLERAGYEVSREYYINDAGRQMRTLGRSVLYRYYELLGRSVDFPSDFYQGDYIRDLAVELRDREGDLYLEMDEDRAVDDVYPWAAGQILDGIRKDLESFGVRFDVWFSEQSLLREGKLQAALDSLAEKNRTYTEEGALWFAATEFGDDKDRVLVKSNGDNTYFATDIAYHFDKYQRGFEWVINLWGADHHGYVARMKSAVQALGYGREQLGVLLVQLVNLLRAGRPVAMSTRAGEFVTLREVVDEVGPDAARFMFLTRSSDSHLDFDLDLAKSQSTDNPVYYVQYAHARICSVYKTADAAGLDRPEIGRANLDRLVLDEELDIIKHLAGFPDLVAGAAASLEPHRLTHYLTELAKKFHPYYNKNRFVGDDRELSSARLALAEAVRVTLANGLAVLGVSAPEKM